MGVLSGAHCSVLLGAEGGRFSLLGHFIIASQSILRNINEMQKFRVDITKAIRVGPGYHKITVL